MSVSPIPFLSCKHWWLSLIVHVLPRCQDRRQHLTISLFHFSGAYCCISWVHPTHVASCFAWERKRERSLKKQKNMLVSTVQVTLITPYSCLPQSVLVVLLNKAEGSELSNDASRCCLCCSKSVLSALQPFQEFPDWCRLSQSARNVSEVGCWLVFVLCRLVCIQETWICHW